MLNVATGDYTRQQQQQEAASPLFAWLSRTLRDAALTKVSFYFDGPLTDGALDQEEHERNRKARLSVDLHAR